MNTTPLQSKADRDRLRHRAGGNAKIVGELRRILREYRQGRAASACMADLERTVKGKKDARPS